MALSTDALHLRTTLLLRWLRDKRDELEGIKPDGPWKKGRLLELNQHVSTMEEIELRIRAALAKKGGKPNGRNESMVSGTGRTGTGNEAGTGRSGGRSSEGSSGTNQQSAGGNASLF